MGSTHPLDPLTSSEIKLTSMIVRDAKPELAIIFNSMVLIEPPKKDVITYLNDPLSISIARKANATVIDRTNGDVYEVTVNICERQVESFVKAPKGSQPTLSPEDCFLSEEIAKKAWEVRERCEKLGLESMNLVVADPWSIGYTEDEELKNKRLVQLFMYFREYEDDNHYAHPLDFVVIVDLISETVVRIDDLPAHRDFTPRKPYLMKPRRQTCNYYPQFFEEGLKPREDLKELQVISPQGPSFAVNGNEIQWQKFRFRISFNYREGLVLHNITYQDKKKVRPLFYRASLSEMVVPYGDPRPPFERKCAFDIGDYGLGFCANSLELGCDCLGTIHYFDGILNNHEGEPVLIKNVVCLHEEDAGLLHKHTEYRNGKVCVARSRKLVISFIVTVVNYEYAVYWNFFQDGTINLEIKATGELSTNFFEQGEDPAGFGTIVFPGVNGQFHQHIFTVRLDPMVDGLLNSVSTLDVKPVPYELGSSKNPNGQGFDVTETVLGTSKVACTDVSPKTFRTWKIFNPSSIHPYTGKPVGWKLVPTSQFCGMLARPGSRVRYRAGFANHSVWVTQFSDKEYFAAGHYVNQSSGGEGLVKWAERDEKVHNEDIIVWHVMGVTHIPRVEDFPIMPVESCGFTLKPLNFFDGNPGLDVPPPQRTSNGSCHC